MKGERGYYTPGEAAGKLGVSLRTVMRWLKAGKVVSTRSPGGRWRIPAEWVAEELVALGRGVKPTASAPVAAKRLGLFDGAPVGRKYVDPETTE